MNASSSALNLLVSSKTSETKQLHTQDDHHAVIVVYLVFECLIGVTSVCTNSMVLLAMTKERKLRTITNCFVGSLAAADVLVGIVSIPVAILTAKGLPNNFTLCVLMNSISKLLTLISVLNLLSVALDRFCAIRVPFHYRNVMSVARARRLVGIIWLFAIFIGLIPLFGWNNREHTFKYCSFHKVISLEYMVYLILFVITLPSFIVMVLCYVYIFRVVRSTKQAMLKLMVRHGREITRLTIKNNMRGDKGILMVIILFVICWMPFHVVNCLLLWGGSHSVPLGVYFVSIALSHCNSFVNPFLFAFGNSQFKVTIKSILCGASTIIESKEVDRVLEQYGGEAGGEAEGMIPCTKHLMVLGVSIILTSNSSESVAFFEGVAEDIRQHPFSGPTRDHKRTTSSIWEPHSSFKNTSHSTTRHLHPDNKEFLTVSMTVARDIRERTSSASTLELKPMTSFVKQPPSLTNTSPSTTLHLTPNSTESVAVSEDVAVRIHHHPSSEPNRKCNSTTSIISSPL
ncbi:adenosine receptor A3-like [Littorina saxatilis]|uniref:adenosine receptor A3-like n=1 Tax=Littorina saxatilis TaxID=31220 RepID=UPI0038B5F949